MKTLHELARYLGFTTLTQDNVAINHLRIDSRDVTAGDVFLAIKGHHADGRQYIQQAIQNGAVAILSQAENNQQTIAYHQHIPVLQVVELDKKQSQLANYFYDVPSTKMQVVGITGTNGKTTISNLIAQWATLLGNNSAVMGTLGNGPLNALIHSNNTTVSAIDLQRLLAEFLTHKVTLTAMEVSSHGLDQHRVDDINFSTVAFTNLTRDHLDYHGNMAAYEAAKWRLFSEFPSVSQVINADDPIGRKWLEKLPNAVAVSLTDSTLSQYKKWLIATQIDYKTHGVSIAFNSSWGAGVLESHLIGEFNISNLLISLAVLLTLGYSLAALIATSEQLKPVNGRMDTIKLTEESPTVVIDYAHTPDALEKALTTVKLHCNGKLWCIFGCGGDRDKGKRPIMATIAERYADKIIVTDDNPRTESSEQIIKDVLAGFENLQHVTTIANRQQAIEHALSQAKSDDIILIAGKGHETEQIVGDKVFYHSDHDIVKHYKAK